MKPRRAFVEKRDCEWYAAVIQGEAILSEITGSQAYVFELVSRLLAGEDPHVLHRKLHARARRWKFCALDGGLKTPSTTSTANDNGVDTVWPRWRWKLHATWEQQVAKEREHG